MKCSYSISKITGSFFSFPNISISKSGAFWLLANSMSRSKGSTERMSICYRSNYTYSLGKGQFYYARTTHTVCLLYFLISKQKHQIPPKTHMMWRARLRNSHVHFRDLLQLTELGFADTTVLMQRDVSTDYITHRDFLTYILGEMNMTLILIVIKQVHCRCVALRYHIARVTARTC